MFCGEARMPLLSFVSRPQGLLSCPDRRNKDILISNPACLTKTVAFHFEDRGIGPCPYTFPSFRRINFHETGYCRKLIKSPPWSLGSSCLPPAGTNNLAAASEGGCGPSQFQCMHLNLNQILSINDWNRRPRECIPEGYRCDGRHDCQDGSDEVECFVKLPRRKTFRYFSRGNLHLFNLSIQASLIQKRIFFF